MGIVIGWERRTEIRREIENRLSISHFHTKHFMLIFWLYRSKFYCRLNPIFKEVFRTNEVGLEERKV